jgi:hypothetical protein
MGQAANGYFDGAAGNIGISPNTQIGINANAPLGGRPTYHVAGAPVNGAAGTFFGVAPKYSILIRDDTGVYHMNTGTLASPTWTIIAGTP